MYIVPAATDVNAAEENHVKFASFDGGFDGYKEAIIELLERREWVQSKAKEKVVCFKMIEPSISSNALTLQSVSSWILLEELDATRPSKYSMQLK